MERSVSLGEHIVVRSSPGHVLTHDEAPPFLSTLLVELLFG